MHKEETNRVDLAIAEKASKLMRQLQKFGIEQENIRVLFVGIKQSDELLVYAKNTKDISFQKIASYTISKRSGQLGPKKKEGDKQVPEGLYYINRFNPKSKYYLSLGLNYPNAYDLQKGYTGSDIFIHGGTESQGCLPVTDDKMKELYLYALWASKAGQQNIPVYIFPFPMLPEEIKKYQNTVDAETLNFWQNLQTAYHLFHKNQQELKIEIIDGKYIFQ